MKFTPHIVIWELDLKIDGTIIDSYYFLTHRGAEKFWEKNKEKRLTHNLKTSSLS